MEAGWAWAWTVDGGVEDGAAATASACAPRVRVACGIKYEKRKKPGNCAWARTSKVSQRLVRSSEPYLRGRMACTGLLDFRAAVAD